MPIYTPAFMLQNPIAIDVGFKSINATVYIARNMATYTLAPVYSAALLQLSVSTGEHVQLYPPVRSWLSN